MCTSRDMQICVFYLCVQNLCNIHACTPKIQFPGHIHPSMNESLPDANVGACSRQCLDRGPCTGIEYGGGVIALITIPSAFIVFF